MQWKHPSSVAKKFKMQTSADKLMLTIFWDSHGPVVETYLNMEQLTQMQPIVTSFREG
jgi:hypothetical protein